MTVAAAAGQPVTPAGAVEVSFEALKRHLGAALQFAQSGGTVVIIDRRTGQARARITGILPDGSWAVPS